MTLVIGDDGWIEEGRAERAPSDNCGPRPDDVNVDLLVLHCISLPEGQYGNGYVQRFFTNALSEEDEANISGSLRGDEGELMKVSAHAFIERTGKVIQFVSFAEQAWHAGKSRHEGRENCNDFSVGIELEGKIGDPFSEQQYQALAALSAGLMARYPDITLERVVGHSDVAVGRKEDPGSGFDWQRYRAELGGLT